MTSTIRILYVVNDAGFFLSHRLSLALAARDAGFDVHVATPLGNVSENIQRAGFTFHAIAMRRQSTGLATEGRALARRVYGLDGPVVG